MNEFDHCAPIWNPVSFQDSARSLRKLERIMSGGQTGADRAALEVAIELEIPHGGWCPAGRRAEDGVIPERFLLSETRSTSYLVRNEWNVRDSDATVIFTMKPPQGGSLWTIHYANMHRRPYIHLNLMRFSLKEASAQLLRFLNRNPKIRCLNIAGSRESTSSGIFSRVKEILLISAETSKD